LIVSTILFIYSKICVFYREEKKVVILENTSFIEPLLDKDEENTDTMEMNNIEMDEYDNTEFNESYSLEIKESSLENNEMNESNFEMNENKNEMDELNKELKNNEKEYNIFIQEATKKEKINKKEKKIKLNEMKYSEKIKKSLNPIHYLLSFFNSNFSKATGSGKFQK
jgi:hypothetical protein